MSLPQPDLGVLRKAQRGDERAFSIIVRTYEQPVYNYVLRLTGDRSLSEDLTQEVFLRVFQGLPSFSLRSRFTTWLFQVTKNRVLDELRAIERRPRAIVNIEDAPPLEVVDAPAERSETIDAVWRAIEGPLLHGDRRDARSNACDREVAHLQGARGSTGRAPP
jgi:RNA polymerase sigma-70 factor, ECF subfamily